MSKVIKAKKKPAISESDTPYDPEDENAVTAFWDKGQVNKGYEAWKVAHIKEGLKQADRGEFVPESQWRKAFNRGVKNNECL